MPKPPSDDACQRTPSEHHMPFATNGMVTSPHHLATEAGLHVLQKGGNALDATIACAMTLNVVYPHMTSLGGDAFWLIYDSTSGTLHGINASGRAAEKASIRLYSDLGLRKVPERGPLAAITVPGFLSGIRLAKRYSEEHLASRIALEELLARAILYAEEGYPVSTSFARWSASYLERHSADPERTPLDSCLAETFFRNGRPYRTGERFIQKDLARTLRHLSDAGCEDMYRGELADRIVQDLQRRGGLLSAEDLAGHTAEYVEPVSVPYRDCTAWNLPPNTQGLASLEILNILNSFDLTCCSESDYYHLLIEATKLAFLDRDAWITDPAYADIPVAELLSAEHGRTQAQRIDLQKALPLQQTHDAAGDTCWFGVVDRTGTAVSVIQSVYYDFGSAVVPEGTGILLQNRGSFFSLDPGHINCLAPHKRTFHTLNPPMLLRNGRPFLVYGTMGGEGQPQTQAQVVTRILDLGMTPGDAIRAPRFLYGRAWGEETTSVQLEGRISDSVCADLRLRGHTVEMREAFSDAMGHAGAILCHADGVLQGGCDPRSDGLVSGY